ncbi:MAG: DUF167 domain-containing protein [Rhodoferax sp.]|jgi:uncharacterized protein (TIGR00251 family)|nr:DUF167 domain-containing protein [Rhodoferax sp.]
MSSSPVKNITGDSFFAWDGDVLVVNILGKPSASKDAIGKPKGSQLKVSVTAAPQNGKATDHMLRFLAPLFGVSVSAIEVVFGQQNVNKQLRIRAPARLPPVFAGLADQPCRPAARRAVAAGQGPDDDRPSSP